MSPKDIITNLLYFFASHTPSKHFNEEQFTCAIQCEDASYASELLQTCIDNGQIIRYDDGSLGVSQDMWLQAFTGVGRG